MTESIHFIEYYPPKDCHPGVPGEFVNASRVLDISTGMSFYCTGGREATCHVYPDNREEWSTDDKDETFVPHDRCWISDWMDHGEALIPHGDDPEDYRVKRGRHPIEVTWEGDHVTWYYVQEAGR